jgi:hypothetical protein
MGQRPPWARSGQPSKLFSKSPGQISFAVM